MYKSKEANYHSNISLIWANRKPFDTNQLNIHTHSQEKKSHTMLHMSTNEVRMHYRFLFMNVNTHPNMTLSLHTMAVSAKMCDSPLVKKQISQPKDSCIMNEWKPLLPLRESGLHDDDHKNTQHGSLILKRPTIVREKNINNSNRDKTSTGAIEI